MPLRNITTKSVAQAMWEVFSRIGIPQRILTDCGSQFMAKAMKELCALVGIEKVTTTPYHPETNGCIERMHRTLKSILKKIIDRKKDWVIQMPYALFSLRSLPLEGHGFTPFDLVHGFRQRTPLEAIYHNLVEQHHEQQQLMVSEWVDRMASTLEEVREIAALSAAKCTEKRKRQHDKHAKARKFEKGDLVWYRIPGLHDKLSESWDGPFEIVERKGEVTYKIRRQGKVRGEKTIHINNLMKYNERKDVCRVNVVLEEDAEKETGGSGCKLSGECEGYNGEELEELIEEFVIVFSGNTGSTDVVQLRIDTKELPPIAQPPYSVPLSMRESVRDELSALEEAGIIRRSDSTWASPLVPVRKKSGKVRLCVDYRKVNGVTTPEPYYMPGFEEMMNKIGGSKVLSKLDLVKGFHQVGVHPEDREKTAFICPWGKWEYLRMPFGLCNAPATFQKLMTRVLAGCEEFSNVYIDDILVGSSSWDEHLTHLRVVFKRLEEAGLTCQVSKCDFGRLEFLGHQIGEDVMSVPEHRVKALLEYKQEAAACFPWDCRLLQEVCLQDSQVDVHADACHL